MKLLILYTLFILTHVAPLAGAWIETNMKIEEAFCEVAPLAGAWIETKK